MATTRARLAVTVAALAISSRASAEPMRWDAPAGCPDAAGERDRIERRRGESLDAVDLDAMGAAIEHTADGYAAELALPSGEIRRLRAATCDEVAEAIAVIVARVAVAKRAPEVAVVPPGEAANDLVAVPAVVPEQRHRRAWTFGARLSTLGTVGVVPGVGFGAELVASLHRKNGFAELGGARWLDGSEQLDGVVERVTIAYVSATARIGWQWTSLPLRAWAVTELGSMQGTGMSAVGQRKGSSAWLGTGAGVAGLWHASPTVAVVGSVEALAALERARFQLADGTEVYQPSPVAARAALGVELAW